MTMLPATLPSGRLYYRHSGKFDPLRTVAAVVASMAVALICGAAYSYAVMYSPIVGWVTFILTGGTGFVVGFVLGKLLLWARVRNLGIGLLITQLVALVLLAFSWEVYIYAYLIRGQVDVDFMDLLRHPDGVWNVILFINEHGAWNLQGGTPTGLALWALWLVEAAFLLGIPVWWVSKMLRQSPFCETCLKWGVSKSLIGLDPNSINTKEFKQRLEAKDFSAIAAANPAARGAMNFLELSLQGCSGCDNTQTLCLNQVILTYNKKGKLQTKRVSIVNRLLLTPEETVGVAIAVSEISAKRVALAAQKEAAAEEAQTVAQAAQAPVQLSESTPPPPAGPSV